MFKRHGLLIVALAAMCGCADIAPPRIFHPGPAEDQRRRAERFDPYPMTDVAPVIGGGRPLQYDRPAPETELMQNDVTFGERFRQPPPPGTYRPSRALNGNRQTIVYPVQPDLQSAPPFVPGS